MSPRDGFTKFVFDDLTVPQATYGDGAAGARCRSLAHCARASAVLEGVL